MSYKNNPDNKCTSCGEHYPHLTETKLCWRCDLKLNTHVCTAADPWTGQTKRAMHPDAREVGDQENGWPGGDIVRFHCPNCNHAWREELAQ